MRSLIIAGTNLRRFGRDRTNIFFVFIFPMLLILVLGSLFGGGFNPRLGVVIVDPDDPRSAELVDRLQQAPGLDVEPVEGQSTLTRKVERGELEAGLVVPALTPVVSVAELELVTRPDQQVRTVQNIVESVLAEEALVLRAAAVAESRGLASFENAVAVAEDVRGSVEPVEVTTSREGEPLLFTRLGQFDLGAQSQLVLFIFLTSLTGSAALIQTRRLGVASRMISTPTTVGQVLVGEGLGRLAVALVQGLFIMFGTLLLFGVDWGDLAIALAIVVLFALVGSGAAMLMGAVFQSDQQAGGLGVLLGLGAAALGGCMIPLVVFEILAPTMYRVAHVTPHAWALRAFDASVTEGGGWAEVMPFLAVLAGYALVLYVLAVWRLRVALTT